MSRWSVNFVRVFLKCSMLLAFQMYQALEATMDHSVAELDMKEAKIEEETLRREMEEMEAERARMQADNNER